MESTLQNPQVMDEYLFWEVQLSRVATPFPLPPPPALHIGRFGIIPKRGRLGKWRLIVALLHPAGNSVDDGIIGDNFTLSYTQVEDAIDFIDWRGLQVRFLCDNQGVVDVITKHFGFNRALGGLLGSLFLAAAHHSFWVSASHVPGRTWLPQHLSSQHHSRPSCSST